MRSAVSRYDLSSSEGLLLQVLCTYIRDLRWQVDE